MKERKRAYGSGAECALMLIHRDTVFCIGRFQGTAGNAFLFDLNAIDIHIHIDLHRNSKGQLYFALKHPKI